MLAGHSVKDMVAHLVEVRREKLLRRFCHQGEGWASAIDKLIHLSHGDPIAKP